MTEQKDTRTITRSRKNRYTKTVRLRVDVDRLDDITEQRLRRLVDRDDALIRRIIDIISLHKERLVENHRGVLRVDSSGLHAMIYTTEQRSKVLYDLKEEFYPVDANSLIECRRSAEWLYNSWLMIEKGWKEQGLKFQRDVGSTSKKHARSVDTRRFELVEELAVVGIIDSCRPRPQNSRRLRRLWLPVVLYDHGSELINQGELRELQVVEQDKQWWIHLRIRMRRQHKAEGKDPGMVGIDLGINKSMVVSLLTKEGVRESRVLHDAQQVSRWKRVEQKRRELILSIKQLQQEVSGRCDKTGTPRRVNHVGTGINQEAVELGLRKEGWQKLHDLQNLQNVHKLQRLQEQLDRSSHRVRDIKQDLDRQQVAQLVIYLQRWQKQYELNLHVVIGDLSGINFRAKQTKNFRHRHRLQRWSYRRMTKMIEQKLAQHGIRLHQVYEYYTSSHCHRCRKRGVRPRQHTFYCSWQECGWRGNADINASINIAKQGIYYLKLRQEFTGSRIENWLAPGK